MLNRVHIKNVRSCGDVILDGLGRITALVGRNSVGKTNIMRAIDFAAHNSVNPKSFELHNISDILPPRPNTAEVNFEFDLNRTIYKYIQAISISPKSPGPAGEPQPTQVSLREALNKKNGSSWLPIISREGSAIQFSDGRPEVQIADFTPCLPAITSLLPPNDALNHTIQPVMNFLRSIHYYPLDEPNVLTAAEAQGFIKHTDYAQWLLEQTRGANPVSSVLMRIVHMSQQMPNDFAELKELLGPNGLAILKDIRVQLIRAATASPDKGAVKPPDDKSDLFYYLQFLPNLGGNNLRQYSEVSFGTRRLLRILASIICDKSLVMLIEQPEDGIHLGLLHKLISLLHTYADPAQVILASHSPAVFNGLTPDEIRLVYMRDGTTHLRALTPEEMKGAKNFISEEGPLSDFIETIENGD